MSTAAANQAAKKAPTVFQTWFRAEVIPIYGVLGFAVGGAGKFFSPFLSLYRSTLQLPFLLEE